MSKPPLIETIDQVAGCARISGYPRVSAMEPHSSLKDDLGWEALDRHGIAVDIEKFFDIEIPVDEELTWLTVADICRTVERCRAEAAPQAGAAA